MPLPICCFNLSLDFVNVLSIKGVQRLKRIKQVCQFYIALHDITCMYILYVLFKKAKLRKKIHQYPIRAKEATSGGGAVPDKTKAVSTVSLESPESAKICQDLPSHHLCGKELWTPLFLPWRIDAYWCVLMRVLVSWKKKAFRFAAFNWLHW